MGSYCLKGTMFQFEKIKKFAYGGDGCMTI